MHVCASCNRNSRVLRRGAGRSACARISKAHLRAVAPLHRQHPTACLPPRPQVRSPHHRRARLSVLLGAGEAGQEAVPRHRPLQQPLQQLRLLRLHLITCQMKPTMRSLCCLHLLRERPLTMRQ